MRQVIDNKHHSLMQPAKPKLLDQVRAAIRCRHYSRRTEDTYIHWIKRFIFFNNKRHPEQMGETEITEFLNHLAVERNVAAATQNQALSALLFLYRDVLEKNSRGLIKYSMRRNRFGFPPCFPPAKFNGYSPGWMDQNG